MSGAFSVVNILADSVGPGTVGIHGDSQHYFLSSGTCFSFYFTDWPRTNVVLIFFPWFCLPSFHDHGHHSAAHVLGRGLLWRLREAALVGRGCRCHQPPACLLSCECKWMSCHFLSSSDRPVFSNQIQLFPVNFYLILFVPKNHCMHMYWLCLVLHRPSRTQSTWPAWFPRMSSSS